MRATGWNEHGVTRLLLDDPWTKAVHLFKLGKHRASDYDPMAMDDIAIPRTRIIFKLILKVLMQNAEVSLIRRKNNPLGTQDTPERTGVFDGRGMHVESIRHVYM